ncbi:AEC family transporter [uncultured Dubosiella sp.]|uniref:AEC family transporter n=1 Tax=uncultured Dubosiella sp. TaxID=1937011 RepID=UPI0025B30516|nr:AEC family transporter [uncultured Dubosiella sp.]
MPSRCQGLYWILNRFLYRTWGNGEQICAKYATMVTNASFIGMPIAQSLYGATGLLFASISVLPQRVLMWSYGLSLYTNQKQDVDWRKILFHPCVVSIFIGIGVMAAYGAGFVLPEGVSKTLSMVGSCSTPLCLVIIGTIVGRLDWNDLFPWRGFLFSVYRVLFPPAMALLLVWCLLVNTLAKQISILLAAMSTTVILAEKYQKNPKFASQLMVLSTFLSFVSIPLFTFVLQWI